MTVLAPDSPASDEQLELELLIKEARRRQRRRRISLAGVLVLAAAAVFLGVQSAASAPRPGSLLARPLHFPSLGPGGRCPATSGQQTTGNPYFDGGTLGRGPVRVSFGNAGDFARGRVELGTGGPGPWRALETIWFAVPGYDGPFVVRAARLGKPGPIEVQPGADGQSPGSGPIVVPSWKTLSAVWNSGSADRAQTETYDGYPVAQVDPYPPPGPGTPGFYRTVPGSTWVKAPGCYAWQVDGRGFSEVIVAKLLAAGS
jgi:hypothetical protein